MISDMYVKENPPPLSLSLSHLQATVCLACRHPGGRMTVFVVDMCGGMTGGRAGGRATGILHVCLDP